MRLTHGHKHAAADGPAVAGSKLKIISTHRDPGHDFLGITSTSDLSDSGLEKALMGAHQASEFGNPDDVPGFSPLATAPQPDLHRPVQEAQGIQRLLEQLLDAEQQLLGRHPAIGTLPYNAMNEGSSERIYLCLLYTSPSPRD